MSTACTAPQSIAQFLDATLLTPDAQAKDIDRLCAEAQSYKVWAVCVGSMWAPRVEKILRGTGIKLAVVIGFPLGYNLSDVKAFEAERAIGLGADELDMVIPVGRLKAAEDWPVRRDIEAVVQKASSAGRPVLVKVILETALLSHEEKVRGCSLASEAGAHFVKTSTGFGPGGATVEDVRLLRSVVGDRMGVKASGGIRNLAKARAMLEAGASRIGTSATVAILEEEKQLTRENPTP